jgi:phage gp29-like protein
VQLLEGSLTPKSNPTKNKEVDDACAEHIDFNLLYKAQSILLNAIPFGIAVCEIVWEKKGGLYVPASFIPVPRQALSFPQNGEYGVPYLALKNEPLDAPYKFLVHRNDTGDGNVWGTPALKSAYWPWRFKKMGFKFWIMAAEKIGVPSILALFETKTEGDARARADELAKALRGMGSGSSGAFGNVKDIKVVDSAIKDFDTIVSTCNTEIAYAITGQSLATNAAMYGTKAQAVTHEETYKAVTTGDAYLMQQTLQKLYDYFVAVNFPGAEAPQYDIDSTDYAAWEVVRDAIDRGIPVSLNALYDKNHIPRPKDDADSFVKVQGALFSDDAEKSFFFRRPGQTKS